MEHLDEGWDRALAIVAHPDDMEYGAAAAVARWTAQGKQVAYVIATSGEAGIDGMDPATAARVRRREQVTAAAAVGVEHVTFLGLPDGVVEYSVALRRLLAEQIRRHRPDVVLTTTHHLTFGDRQLNQADHRHVALATYDAVKDAGNRWIHPDLTHAGLEPHAGVRSVLVFGSGSPTHAVDVTDHLDAGVASLRAHATYLAGLGREFDPEAFLSSMTSEPGRAVGRPHAVAFEQLSAVGV
ncbi:PIG-L family deacetylase [Cellulomonas sp. APG4]|uniref:PIG-L deacetylase family protein n=1 Tax=Cellulomonas sp. APG4 TaxID=1538656 RepID=UPI00137A86AE|nr:PIG-L deacetylase family protein [Cellulomonas sp. APG4]NCT90504.1 PIG-L family deacetylase [Cellulomonas sp. APG4]